MAASFSICKNSSGVMYWLQEQLTAGNIDQETFDAVKRIGNSAAKDDAATAEYVAKFYEAYDGVDIDFELGVVSVDGSPLDEPYTLTPTNIQEGVSFPLTVAQGCVFVMGDNRNDSKDSRHPDIGLIDKREVLGKVCVLFLPGTHFGTEERDFRRIGVVK